MTHGRHTFTIGLHYCILMPVIIVHSMLSEILMLNDCQYRETLEVHWSVGMTPVGFSLALWILVQNDVMIPNIPVCSPEFLGTRTGSSLTRAATHLDLLNSARVDSEVHSTSFYCSFLSPSPYISLPKDCLNSNSQELLMKRIVVLYMLS